MSSETLFVSERAEHHQFVRVLGTNIDWIASLPAGGDDPWLTPEVEIFAPSGGAAPTDFLWILSTLCVMRPRAVEAMEPLLACGELLELNCAEEVYVFRPSSPIDVLNEERSELLRFSSGRIMEITKHAFTQPRPPGAHVFKLAQFDRGPVFFSTEFVERARHQSLSGLDFVAVGTAPMR